MTDSRNLSFDFLKGFLIILVITGHILPGNADEGVRGYIYYFHMPLFLGVTGYFIKSESINKKWIELFKKYWIRMLIPYVIAFLFYVFFDFYISDVHREISVKYIATTIIYPFYHLWYIPAILIFIMYTKIMIRNNFLIISFVFFTSSLFTIYWYSYGECLENSDSVLKFFGDKRFYYYYLFFLFGFLIGNKKISMSFKSFFCIFLLAFVISGVAHGNVIIESLSWYLFNISLIGIAINFCESIRMHNINLITRLGQVSLPIYLWHVMVIIIFKELIDDLSGGYYLLVVSLLFVLVIFFISMKGRFDLLNKYFYGEVINRNS